jgi:hypothetical protein
MMRWGHLQSGGRSLSRSSHWLGRRDREPRVDESPEPKPVSLASTRAWAAPRTEPVAELPADWFRPEGEAA